MKAHIMARIPQVMLTLAPDGSIVAEFPTPNGLRRHVPIPSEPALALETIRRILSAQLGNRPQTIGTDAKPTSAQVRHWQEHLDQGKTDPMCPWCIAAELGIDTSQSAYKRAQAYLRAQRRETTRRNFHYAGDGTVKVYTQGRAGKAKQIFDLDMQSLLDGDDDDEDDISDVMP